MAYFPDDVIREILSRVPAKSILRFRCVSKNWLSLTTDPSFIKLHLHRSIENNCLNLVVSISSILTVQSYDSVGFWQSRRPNLQLYSLPNNSLHQGYIQTGTLPYFDCSAYRFMTGWCNGLVCYIERNRGMLLNPTTREFKDVEFHNEFNSRVVSLAYDSIMDDYKLVQFLNGNRRSRRNAITGRIVINQSASKIVIHSLNDSPPLTISDVPYYTGYIHYMQDRGVYFNGALHWVGERMETIVPPQHPKVIVSFDVAHKVVREFPLPDSADTISEVITLCLLQGQLSSFLNLSSSFEIWIMKIYGAGGSWYKLASIDKAVYGTTLKDASLLCVSESGGVLLNDYRNLFLYDLDQKTCKTIEIEIPGIKGSNLTIAGFDQVLSSNLTIAGFDQVLSCVSSCVSLQSGKSSKIPQKDPGSFGVLAEEDREQFFNSYSPLPPPPPRTRFNSIHRRMRR